MQGRHSRFLAGKAVTVSATSLALRPFSNSQNLVKEQALTALPPVADLLCNQSKEITPKVCIVIISF